MNHSLTTLGDLSDEDNVRQAEHELRRAGTDAALADWVRRWGGAADDLARAEADATKAEEDLAEIKQAAETLIKVLDDTPDHSEKLDAAIAALENAL